MQERKCKHAGLSEEEERAGMTKRYFEGELKSLRDKLGEKDRTPSQIPTNLP